MMLPKGAPTAREGLGHTLAVPPSPEPGSCSLRVPAGCLGRCQPHRDGAEGGRGAPSPWNARPGRGDCRNRSCCGRAPLGAGSLLSTPKARPPRAMPMALPLSESSGYTLASRPRPGGHRQSPPQPGPTEGAPLWKQLGCGGVQLLPGWGGCSEEEEEDDDNPAEGS